MAALERQLENLKSGPPAPREADCPDDSVWREIAAAVTPPEEALSLLRHASRCDHCGPLLREAVADMNGEITETEAAQIAALESAREDWQRKVAQQITGTSLTSTPPPWWKTWISAPRLALASASLLALVVVGWWVAERRSQSASAADLLASAYAEQRTMELRIAGAPYAPLRVQRGGEGSFLNRPESLLKAEALIGAQLASHPSDPAWLQAKAQADLLEGKYDGAVESLRRALQLAPGSTGILIDLATAYSQRAQAADRADDFGSAFEYLSRALTLEPDNPVALFNRAIVAEHQFLYHQALEDWEHYLRVDPRSEWSDEARKRSDALRAKLQKHDQSRAAPLLSPRQVAAATGNASLSAEIDQRIEEYLQEAVRSWLPGAYPPAGKAADASAVQALFFLADLTSQQHNDRWLSDLLQGSSAHNFPEAVAALARASHANNAGEYGASREQAVLAGQLFRSSENIAGTLRALFEQTFAAQMTRQSEACRQQATAALRESEKHSYPWLQIQLDLERSVCSGLLGDLGADEKAAQRAQSRAHDSGYGALYLRGLCLVADYRYGTGDLSGAWTLVSAGLQDYWSGEFPPIRGYNFYTFLAYMADARALSNLQVAIWRDGIELIDSDPDLLQRALAHISLADAATAAGQPQIAAEQYAEAARLYALAPQTDASRNDALELEIRRAQLEARLGDSNPAFARLARVQSQLLRLSNNYLVQMFYSTLGELQLRRQRVAEAEQALGPALALAEHSLASLSSEAERTSWRKDAAPVYLALTEAELVQARTQESLETYEWYLGTSQRAATDRQLRRATTNPIVPKPPRLNSRFPLLSHETVLAYGVLPDGLAIWVCDDRGVHAEWIAKPTQDLQELAGRFYDLSSDPKSELSALHRDGRSLYQSLIAPVESQLAPGRTLVIEAEGWLAQVPFEALVDSDNHYLIERWAVVYSLGQDLQARLHSDGPISPDLPALVVGSTASSAEGGLIPLPDVAAETEMVASGFHSPRILMGAQATVPAVQEELPQAGVFHFSGHSFTRVDQAGLLLEPRERGSDTPELLDAAALRRLPLQNMRLAVLSACSTASGTGASGGFSSVAEALLRNGVPHVVASRWAVDSIETRGFVDHFYRNALAGQLISEAIRMASRNMLADPRTAHPYYWSAFSAYGRP